MPLVAFFSDRRAAFRFVAEVRRLYDVSRWSTSEVVPTRDGAVVHLAAPPWITGSLRELAVRFGGQLASTVDDARQMIDGAKADRMREMQPSAEPQQTRSFEHASRRPRLHARHVRPAGSRNTHERPDDEPWLRVPRPTDDERATLRR